MRQKALFLATIAALALAGAVMPGAVLAAGQHGTAFRPAFRPPFRPPLPSFAQHPHGFRHPHEHFRPHLRALVPFNSYGWPVVIPDGGGNDIVTHEFSDPRFYGRPRLLPRSVEIVSDKPVVFREPTHIIELGRQKRRAPITVVRRGVISQE